MNNKTDLSGAGEAFRKLKMLNNLNTKNIMNLLIEHTEMSVQDIQLTARLEQSFVSRHVLGLLRLNILECRDNGKYRRD